MEFSELRRDQILLMHRKGMQMLNETRLGRDQKSKVREMIEAESLTAGKCQFIHQSLNFP